MPGKGTRVPENLSETYPVTNHPSENTGGSEMHPRCTRRHFCMDTFLALCIL